ncbi:hypothetical protein DEU56DRAFT_781869 [Suillus clintonianus]|uniref:uncharacterized protein n=1 Tax=Suillus clintonianus TaxID=1904413 RepID=UPI001B885D2A|nr:uncharacterized protein DEU56DRAFT_781869 [Suillus clintonianus]KAG2149371.1 hypothetical protein DEU56DRAFT_781869 [Suillus clintonianus]
MQLTKVKRTYSSRSRLSIPSSSSPPSSPPSTTKRKHLGEGTENEPPTKKRTTTKSLPSGRPEKQKQSVLRQLHFSIETSILRTCTICSLSYTRGAPDDESLHRAHCSRVQRGMEWGREEEREAERLGVEEIQSAVKLKDGKKGRIICFKANVGGRIGSKLAILLETINLALSSPPLSTDILQSSKAYLYLIPSVTNVHREKIVGCVIAQRISTAMTVATHAETLLERDFNQATDRDSPPTHRLVAVDTTSGLFCHLEALPTPLGIPRLFVSSAHRRQGIASRLLTAAAATFIHGCPLDPLNGDVAFTQPTEGGHAVMQNWGKGGVRIYEE